MFRKLFSKKTNKKTKPDEVLSTKENGDDKEDGKIKSSHLYCQPCLEKNESIDGERWCTLCHETLCGSCNANHAVFKATRNHKVIGITEYEDILSVLKGTSYLCPQHPEKAMDVFCLQHNHLFCCSCQINNHQGCETKQIDQMIGVSQHILELDHSFERMSNCIKFVKEMLENRGSARTSLIDARERFLNDLEINRKRVDDWLAKVENEALLQFEQEYKSEKKKIEKQCSEFESMNSVFQKRLEIGIKLAPFKESPTIQMFLAMLQLTHNTKQEYDNLKNQEDSFYNVSVDGAVSLDIMGSDKTIKIINNSQFIHSPCNIHVDYVQIANENKAQKQIEQKNERLSVQKDDTQKQIEQKNKTLSVHKVDTQKQIEEKYERLSIHKVDKMVEKNNMHSVSDDDIFTSSSTVEEEHETVMNSRYRKQKNQIKLPKSISTNLAPRKSYSYSDIVGISHSTSDHNTYKLRYSFYVQKSISEIKLLDVIILPNDELAILECSTPRLLIYDKDGRRKRGQVRLLSTPSCLAIYRDNDVAVTLPCLKKVAIICRLTLTLCRYINVYDECHGVCMIGDMLLVSCANYGLKLINCHETIRGVIPSLKGRLYICSDDEENVFTMKEDSKMIVRYNIYNNKRYNFHVGGNYSPKGITLDCDDDLLFTCSETDGIYRKEISISSEIIISEGINDPSRISYDKETHDIAVINNDGKSISVYTSVYPRNYVCGSVDYM